MYASQFTRHAFLRVVAAGYGTWHSRTRVVAYAYLLYALSLLANSHVSKLLDKRSAEGCPPVVNDAMTFYEYVVPAVL